MLDKYTRVYTTRILTPTARALLKARISPDLVTMLGTIGVTVGAFAFYPRGEFFWGTVVITAFVFSDNIDGIMARLSGRQSNWGAFLDSVLDRFGDAAIFGALALYFAGSGDNLRMTTLLIACLVFGAVVSYARARAESLGYTASGGIAERADRLVAILVTTGFVGMLDLPVVVLEVVLWLLMAASAWTVVQRVRDVHRQAVEV
ncbi:phosphatidylinositol phosphate synthase [Phytoactinopolyspora halotolerans]|uniref:Phosphatidylinositol phosphate synthase n=1 Tax=Phytoactinopolyspora halotolerans TaxID=1981512 RepID=A0A6L9SDU6_9ACTN|nr:CDP-alcohol phosphatidyltransferase family protein [Phytoactinopolyspora halotolerans]NEE03209.1 CDP-alcohol phosphatidyltransferase family protein [Phytoactinopolyspora halotolerans]